MNQTRRSLLYGIPAALTLISRSGFRCGAATTRELEAVSAFGAPFIASKLIPGTELAILVEDDRMWATLEGQLIGWLKGTAIARGGVPSHRMWIERVWRDEDLRLRMSVRFATALA